MVYFRSAFALSAVGLLMWPTVSASQPTSVPPRDSVAQPLGREPRISIELVKIHAIVETGFEGIGSDEIAVETTVGEYSLMSPIFGGMDKGEAQIVPTHAGCLWHPEDDERVDGRWSCRATGGGLPVTLTLSAFEVDPRLGPFGSFIGQAEGFCAPNDAGTGPPGDLNSTSCEIEAYRNADLVGRYRVTYTAENILQELPRVGDSRSETVSVNRCSTIITIEGGVCGTGGPFSQWNGWYALDLRITRQPDHRVDPVRDPGARATTAVPTSRTEVPRRAPNP